MRSKFRVKLKPHKCITVRGCEHCHAPTPPSHSSSHNAWLVALAFSCSTQAEHTVATMGKPQGRFQGPGSKKGGRPPAAGGVAKDAAAAAAKKKKTGVRDRVRLLEHLLKKARV